MNDSLRAKDQPADETSRRRSSGVLQMVAVLVVGIVMGAAASAGLLFGAIDAAAPWVDAGVHVLVPVLGAFGAALALVVPLAWWLVRRFIKGAHGTLEQVVSEATAATRAATQGNAPAAASHTEQAILEALAWYGPIAARRWIVQTGLALLVAFGGLIGTALLFRQTLLLGEQNQKLESQTKLLSQQNELLGEQNQKSEARPNC